MTENPLRDLVVNRNAVTAERLAEVLRGRVVLDPLSGDVYVTATDASARQRVVYALLGVKALATIGADAEKEFADRALPKQLERITGLAGGTVRPVLRSLFRARIVGRDALGYFVADASLDRARAELAPPRAA